MDDASFSPRAKGLQERTPEGSGRAEICIQAMDPETRVRLVHRGLPDDAVSDHGNGWAHYLGRLAIAATGGDAGADIPTTNG